MCNDLPVNFSSLVVMRKGSDADGLGIELVSLDVFFDDDS
jgi:hypothetical protein